jgi:hypothetical protein
LKFILLLIYIMRNFLILLLIIPGVTVFAQDSDNPDYRSKKDNFAKIRDPLIRGDLAAFSMAGIEESTGKQPLKNIPMSDYGGNFMKFDGNNVSVTVRSGLFNPAKHKLSYYDEKFLIKIDGKPYYPGREGYRCDTRH